MGACLNTLMWLLFINLFLQQNHETCIIVRFTHTLTYVLLF